MWKLVKKVGIIIAGIFGVFLAIFAIGGGKKHVEKADEKTEKAKELKARADLIGERIEDLKAKKGKISEETQKEIERIQKLDSLEDISREFEKP